MRNDLAKRLVWSGMLALTGAAASLIAHRVSATVWRRVFQEDPPE